QFQIYKKPHSDIIQNSKGVFINIKLPGINKKDIKLDINESKVFVKAEKRNGIKYNNEYYKGFVRKIQLPSGLKVEKSKIEFNNKTLRINIPKFKNREYY
ncbi:MAG: Hsp20/alpha crystallin family protein, partial [Candidatus Woesearchaeota archaeon]|nr:Hsp20/alpha crystallin family protein [Candidatus Woesearchaeota archaeon]